ncbi:hypothetical protein KIW84_072087 [Lathyrus oleraceus]|uniref:Uncharacterized protein n=1 Tax=Pisum sativum TaxID=3888 RepID=A0A9D4VM18_PEA|nr:hypothetical protein KIW84_072087 [Pisum sativum]
MQIRKARHDLLQAQDNLQHNLFDTQAIKHVKYCTNRVVYLNQLEETILMPKAIVTWLKLGDNNNSYFHAFVKEKNKQKGMYTMTSLNGIEVTTVRNGKTLSRDLAQQLIGPVEGEEIWNALTSIGNNKAPGGLNIVSLSAWNKATISKLLWNI